MKRNILHSLLVIAILLSIAIPVLATVQYTQVFYISSNTTRTSFPAIVTSNNTLLAGSLYMRPDALDTLVVHAGVNVPHMVADNKTLFVSDIATPSDSFQYSMGNSPILSSMPIITGYNGNVTTTDAPAIRPTGNYTLAYNGYTGSANTGDIIFSKPNQITANFTDATHVMFSINATANVSTNYSVYDDLVYITQYQQDRVGQRMYLLAGTVINSVSFYGNDWADEAGNLTCTIRKVSDDGIIGTIGTFPFALFPSAFLSLPPGWVTVSTTPVTIPTSGEFRVLLERASPHVPGQNAILGINNPSITPYDESHGILSTYNGTYHDIPSTSLDFAMSGNFTVPITATSAISPGTHTFTASYSSGIYSVTIDSVSVTDIRSGIYQNWIPYISTSDWLWKSNAVPYINSITLSVNGTQQLYYAPNTIINGTTLPNRAVPGSNNGIITWGANPADFVITNTTLSISSSTSSGGASQEIVQGILPTSSMNSSAGLAAPTNPASPWVEMMGTLWQFNYGIMWAIVGMIAVILSFMVTYIYLQHLFIAGIVSSLVMGLFSTPAFQVLPIAFLYVSILSLVSLVILEVKGAI